jgi:hypothetical protein
MGGGAPMPPQIYVVPNVTFAEPYAQYPQPQQSMAIIGGYVSRNMQNVAAIQSNTAQLGEGNANIAYELGRLHLVQLDQFVGGDVQPYYEQGYNYQDYQHQPPAEFKGEQIKKSKERKKERKKNICEKKRKKYEYV